MAMIKAVFVIVLALAVAVALYTTEVTFNSHHQHYVSSTDASIPYETINRHHIADDKQKAEDENQPEKETTSVEKKKIPAVRVSRFLAAKDEGGENSQVYKNPRAASHCKIDANKCYQGWYAEAGLTTCCGNKCVDAMHDRKNCGECGKMCKYTQACCGGKCVYLAYSTAHCGACYNKCRTTSPDKKPCCIYGMCDYQ